MGRTTANVIEIASAGAVLLGLIFVGFELKQNTEAVESQTSQGLLELANQANNQISSDRELAELILRVNKGKDPLTELEALQYSRFVFSEMNIWEHAFFSKANGTMHSDLWSGYDAAYSGFFCQSWSRVVWKEIEGGFSRQFRAHVNNISTADCSKLMQSGN